MNQRRILLCLLFSVLFLFSMSVMTVYAHPGRTDTNGGHWDRESGEYHYHHGYEAHNHYDVNGDSIVDCPFDFDDKTGMNSRGGSSSTHQNITPPSFPTLPIRQNRETVPTNVKENIATPDENSSFLSPDIVIMLGITSLFLLLEYYGNRHTVYNRPMKRHIQSASVSPTTKEQNLIHNHSTMPTEATHLFCETFHVEDPGIPSEVYFIEGFIPVKGNVTSTRPYGDFTVFISFTGKRYHLNPRCQKSASVSVHLYETGFRYSPCSKCAAGTNNHTPEWYRKVHDIVNNHK